MILILVPHSNLQLPKCLRRPHNRSLLLLHPLPKPNRHRFLLLLQSPFRRPSRLKPLLLPHNLHSQLLSLLSLLNQLHLHNLHNSHQEC